MNLLRKNILIISPEPWDHIFVSKHHYALNLAKKDNHVYFLNPPIKNTFIQKTEYKNLHLVYYTGFIKGLRFMPSFLQKMEIKKIYRKLEDLCKVKFDIIWSFDNSVFYDFSCLPSRITKISHIVDLNQNFQTGKAASTADICFAVSKNIYERLSRYNKKTYFINHGYNFLRRITQKKILPGNNSIKIVYAGNLSMPYIDWKIILDSIYRFPQLDFIFIGPGVNSTNQVTYLNNSIKATCFKSKNVYHVEKVNSFELLSWYESADILLVAYQEEFHKEQSNPHKVMEYLGSGKMIVSTFTEEYISLAENKVITMAKKNKELPDLIEEVIKNLGFYNSCYNQHKRIQFALENTYEKQIERIEIILNDNIDS